MDTSYLSAATYGDFLRRIFPPSGKVDLRGEGYDFKRLDRILGAWSK